MSAVSRRQFLRRAAYGAGAAWAFPELPRRPLPEGAPRAVVARGGAVDARLAAALAPLGGIRAFVAPGSRVVIKPNAAFAEPPKTGGNTTPEVVAAVVRACRAAGAGSVTLVEHCLSNRGQYGTENDMSGITEAARAAGAGLIDTGGDPTLYRDLTIDAPGMRVHPISRPLLDADVVINVPRLKTHPVIGYTMSIKNLMGAMRAPGSFHGGELGERLACLGRALQPRIPLTIVDATDKVEGWAAGRPGRLTRLDTLVAATNMVSADAVGLTLFGKDPLRDCGYVRLADQMGWGVGDPSFIEVVEADL